MLLAGGLCMLLARVFGRLSAVIPSGAGLLAWFSRSLGRRAGFLLAGPYLLLTVFLVGAEATIVGTLLHRVLPWLPIAGGALLFLVGTWAFCRAGLKVGFHAQTVATVALMVLLGALSLGAIADAGDRLPALLLPAAPSPWAFAAAVGQALFLFMGFELLTAHAEQTTPKRLSRSLFGTVGVLTAFYALLALGLACLPAGEALPQLALANGPLLPLIVLVCLLSSFTSFNGALLALSRFTGALAAQGALPKALSRIEPKRLVPSAALTALLVLAIGATALVMWGKALEPAILSAAVAASLLYAAAAWVRERKPFAEAGRAVSKRIGGIVLSLALAALGVGVLVSAGPATLVMVGVTFGVTAVLAVRIKQRAPSPPVGERVGVRGDSSAALNGALTPALSPTGGEGAQL